MAEEHLLHRAVDGGDEAVVGSLLEVGIAVDDRDPQGRTALHLAAREGHDALARALLADGADPALRDPESCGARGRRAWRAGMAARRGRLLAAGAQPGAQAANWNLPAIAAQ